MIWRLKTPRGRSDAISSVVFVCQILPFGADRQDVAFDVDVHRVDVHPGQIECDDKFLSVLAKRP